MGLWDWDGTKSQNLMGLGTGTGTKSQNLMGLGTGIGTKSQNLMGLGTKTRTGVGDPVHVPNPDFFRDLKSGNI